MGRVKVTPHSGAASAARPAMQYNNRRPVRVSALFDVKPMPVAHLDHALIERIDPRVKMRHCAVLS
jgi:hypothetical protein